MSALTVARRGGQLWLLAAAAAIAAAALVRIIGVDELVRADVVAHLEHDPKGLVRILEILARNAALAGAMILAGYLASAAPHHRRPLDIFVVGTAAVLVTRFAVMIGSFGWPLARYMAPYGPLEAAGFAVAVAAYLAARRRPGLPAEQLRPPAALAGALLTVGAVLEARLGGAL